MARQAVEACLPHPPEFLIHASPTWHLWASRRRPAVIGPSAVLPVVAVIGPSAVLPVVAVIGPSAVLPVVAVIGPSAVLPVVAVIGPSAVLPVVAVIGPSAVLPSANPASRAFKAVAADDEPPLGQRRLRFECFVAADRIFTNDPVYGLRRGPAARRRPVKSASAARGLARLRLRCRRHPAGFDMQTARLQSQQEIPPGVFFTLSKKEGSPHLSGSIQSAFETSGKDTPFRPFEWMRSCRPPGYFWEGSTITISLQASRKIQGRSRVAYR